MTRIDFVSCAHPVLCPVQPAWDAIAAAEPDLLLLLGDNTYMSWDGQTWLIDDLRKHYALQFAVPGFRRLLQTVPHMAIWDDHDFGWNDCVGSQLSPDRLAATRALFDQHLGGALNNNRPHMYCSLAIGPVRVIMLDVRTHRTLSTDPDPTVLGKVQEDWLWQQLADNTEPYLVIGSGTPITQGAPGHRLADYSAFHTRLMQELQHRPADAAPRKALFLSGDIHDNAWVRHVGFYEAIASGVACLSRRTQLPTSNWGLLEFDEKKDRVKLTLSGHWPSYVGVHRVRLSDWREILDLPAKS